MKIINNMQHRRFRLEIPTGKTFKKNGEDVPVVTTRWLVGAGDVSINKEDPSQSQLNSFPLTAEQSKRVKADKGLQGMVEQGLLSLVA